MMHVLRQQGGPEFGGEKGERFDHISETFLICPSPELIPRLKGPRPQINRLRNFATGIVFQP